MKPNQPTNQPDSDYLPKYMRSICKRSQFNTIVHGFLQSIWFHTYREDGANDTLWKNEDTEFFNFIAGVLQGHKICIIFVKSAGITHFERWYIKKIVLR